MKPSPSRQSPSFWIPEGTLFDTYSDIKREGIFRVLCASHIQSLKNWNHAHVFDPFWRLYHNSKPGNFIQYEGRQIDLKSDCFVIIPANVLFRTFSGLKPVNHLCIHFALESEVTFRSTKPLAFPVDTASKSISDELRNSLLKKHSQRMKSHQLCLSLLHYLFAAVFDSSQTLTPRRQEIVKVLKAVEANPNDFSNLSQMAKLAGMSMRNFQRAFQESLGKSPTIYIKELRLREAARRLASSAQSIDEIAFELGFANRFHFSRLFRQFIGTPPASFRQNQAMGLPSAARTEGSRSLV